MYKVTVLNKIANYHQQLMHQKNAQHIPKELRLFFDFIEHMSEHCEDLEIYLFQFDDYVQKKGGSIENTYNYFKAQPFFKDFFNEWRRESQNSPDALKAQGCPGLEERVPALSM